MMSDTSALPDSPAPREGRATDPISAWRVAAEWYHAAFTGIILSATVRQGTARAAELVHEIFSHQRQERFLPGLDKLGLRGLPHAVAAAQYHYLSNDIGGVPVQYMPESDRKAWVRYPPPRWVWSGTALCGIPTEVSRAMMTGWHAQNGVSLGNPRLGFVCTGQTTDGDPGLEGYYFEYDRDLAPSERLRFARGERAPRFDPARAPRLPTALWPAERLAKAHRNYAMEYLRTTLPVAVNLWGAHAAQAFLSLTLRLVGMQHYHAAARGLGVPTDEGSIEAFASFMQRMVTAQGDACDILDTGAHGARVRQSSWRLMEDVPALHPATCMAFDGLMQGALAAHNPDLSLKTVCTRQGERIHFEWHIAG